MSLIDFNESARSQGSLHIAVKDLGADSRPFFNAFLQALKTLPPIQLKEPKGSLLFLRFTSYENLPAWATEGLNWSEFNPHKQILGVIGIGRCHDLDDLDNTVSGFKIYNKEIKNSSVCGARCIIYGSKRELEGGLIDSDNQYCVLDTEPTSEDIQRNIITGIVTELALTIHSTLKARISQLEDLVGRNSSSPPLPVLHSPFESKEYLRPEEEPEQR